MMTTCHLLDSLLDDQGEIPKETIELCFVFAAIWGFGGALSVDKGVDYRKIFSDYWKATWADLSKSFDNEALIFDYEMDRNTNELTPWEGSLPVYVHKADVPFYNITVPTVDSVRLTHLTDMLAGNHHPVPLSQHWYQGLAIVFVRQVMPRGAA